MNLLLPVINDNINLNMHCKYTKCQLKPETPHNSKIPNPKSQIPRTKSEILIIISCNYIICSISVIVAQHLINCINYV